MGRIKSRECVFTYSDEFKVKAVKLSYMDGVKSISIVAVLDLHSVILSQHDNRRYTGSAFTPNVF